MVGHDATKANVRFTCARRLRVVDVTDRRYLRDAEMLNENVAQSQSVAGRSDIIDLLEPYLDWVASGVVPPKALVERGRSGSYTDHRTPIGCPWFAEKGRRPKESISWGRVATRGGRPSFATVCWASAS
jgi:hypothetical protein